MPKKRIHKDRSTDIEIVLNVNARYIAMVANGWTPEHLRGIGKKWNAFAPLLLYLKVHLNSEVP
jgi:hypothetical protein